MNQIHLFKQILGCIQMCNALVHETVIALFPTHIRHFRIAPRGNIQIRIAFMTL